MRLAFVKAAKSIGAERLHDAHVNVGIVVLHESIAIERDEAGERVEIVIKQLLAQRRRQVSFGVLEERSDVVLERAFAASLVIHEERITVAQHNVAGLEIAVKKVFVWCA